jgi:hypothetical protein
VELREALLHISEIRQQMARSEIFRGYRSIPVAITGGLGVVAACLQPVFVLSPAQQIDRYLALWIGVAVVGLMLAGVQLARRAQLAGPSVSRELTRLAVEQFSPCVVIGGLVTLCLYVGARDSLWMLPGLWSLFFALGIFSSYRLLPWQVFWAGLYYVVCGCCWLVLGQGEQAFAPWQMGVSFGGGQLLCAAILYWTLERRHDA